MLEGIEGVSSFANEIDNTFIIVTVITLLLFVVTIGSMLYFVYKYSSSKVKKEDAQNIKHYTPIEIAWTVIPTILMMIVFYFGLESLRVQRTMPSDDMAQVVKVTGQRWFWTFEYENGKKTNELTVPKDTAIKLVMTAPEEDVLHSFFVPAFRIKEDVLPGTTTYLWFNAEKMGRYDIQCAEYCGTRHSYMRSFVNVVSKEDYKNFLFPKKEEPKKTAIDLFNDYGCVGCHSLEDMVLVGPSFKDIYNKEVSITSKGVKKVIKRDENYLRNSILNPQDDVVEGYVPHLMPSFKNVINEEELNTIIKYFKGEKEEAKKEKTIDGLSLIQNNGCIGCHSLDGSKIVGPTFKDIYNRKVVVTKGDEKIELTSNEEYLKNSILDPKVEVVENYPNIMPSFKGLLKDEEVDAIIEYLKTIK
ncbi:cytochrome c oxidase subunit II [Poseidonibacter lekithochrous]|uniref:cytochrome c oxidase subunit II n=1 Tax=Poseidonibacter lekithochrous TaxID=1904463 RepID=UPI0008FCD0E9|nr:cytochrome c oxidase subunit II [Poseidonibacter lekithochrous]QKJ23709.1 cytochrome o ubiquinol oxidase, subunit II [Poseidonibacter lekithochrous]